MLFATSKKLRSRIYNWKFTDALQYLEDEDEDEDDIEIIKALAATFGNIGWNMDGAMATIAGCAVRELLGPEEKE